MKGKKAKRALSSLLALCIITSIISIFTISATASGSTNVILDIPWTQINKCGNQYDPSGHSKACQAYALAYCRIILDKKLHIWTEYRAKGSDFLAVAFNAVGYNNKHSSSKQTVLNAVYDNINSGCPVILNVVGKYTTGHYVVAVGYKAGCDPTALKESDIVIIDPSNKNIVKSASNNENYTYLSPNYSLKCNSYNKNLYQYGTAKSGGVSVNNAPISSLERPQPSLSADYFTCDVKIACVNGQVVNLYNNAGDSSRVTYFSRGQVASSTYGAKLSDGSTWYRITADHNGSSRTFWLKYESNKMTVEDRSKPQTYTVTFNAGSGTVSPSSKTYTAGDTYGTLPTPTYPGYVFKGWLSVRDYTYATPSTTVPDSITLYARWEEETPHTHQKGNVSTCENEHPHRNFYICSTCGEQFTDGTTNYVDSCEICNPNNSNNTFDNLANLGQDAINSVNPPHTEHTKDNRIVSSVHPHYVFYTCSVCGEVYSDDSKEAVSTCEECWGLWSPWTSTQVYSSDTRQVETKQVIISDGYTEYRYGRYIDSTGRNNCWCAKYLESLSYVSGKASLQYSNWSTTRYYANGVGWTCGFCNGNHTGVDKVGADGRSWWAEYELPSGDFYWEESRTVPATYQTQYRYRDLIQ